MERQGKEGERRRGRRERRQRRWSQLKAGALDPEGGRAEKGIRSAEAAIISCHHYLYALENYANAISGKKCWTKWVERVKKALYLLGLGTGQVFSTEHACQYLAL